MNMVVVVHPTLDDYASQVNDLAVKYGLDTWLALFENPEKMDDEDKQEFDFITMAVGDQLIHREFLEILEESPGDCFTQTNVEPGCIPGSTVLQGVRFDCRRVRRTHREDSVYLPISRK